MAHAVQAAGIGQASIIRGTLPRRLDHLSDLGLPLLKVAGELPQAIQGKPVPAGYWIGAGLMTTKALPQEVPLGFGDLDGCSGLIAVASGRQVGAHISIFTPVRELTVAIQHWLSVDLRGSQGPRFFIVPPGEWKICTETIGIVRNALSNSMAGVEQHCWVVDSGISGRSNQAVACQGSFYAPSRRAVFRSTLAAEPGFQFVEDFDPTRQVPGSERRVLGWGASW